MKWEDLDALEDVEGALDADQAATTTSLPFEANVPQL